MSFPTDNNALHAAIGCGNSHQQVYSPYALPDGTEPLIFLDFKNETYTVEGSGAALSTILTENQDFGSWDPANVVNGVGLVGANDAAPVFTGDTLALITDGATIVAYFTGSGDNVTFRFELVDSAEYNTYYSYLGKFGLIGEGLLSDGTTNETLGLLADGYHKIALTMIDGKLSVSTDGSAIVTINPAAAWSPAVEIMNMIVANGITLETIGLYPAQPDADLPMLSAP